MKITKKIVNDKNKTTIIMIRAGIATSTVLNTKDTKLVGVGDAVLEALNENLRRANGI